MTATEQIIKDAIEGGYKGEIFKNSKGTQIYSILSHDAHWLSETVQTMQKDVSLILLDPTFWQAVGRTRGWNEHYEHYDHLGLEKDWHGQWHQFISYLANGLTIEEALSALKNNGV